jgi:hypothetical protein
MPPRDFTPDLSNNPRRDRSGSDAALGVIPSWRTAPTRAKKAADYSANELYDIIDEYFTDTYENGRRPTLHDLAGVAGFDSPSHMFNTLRRRPVIARGISRALMAIAAEYEEQLQGGSRSAQWMLERIPNFDTHDDRSVPAPQLPFFLKSEVNVNVSGIISHETAGKQLSEQEAYMQLIKCKTYEEMEQVVELKLDDDVIYGILELDDNSAA